MLFAAIFRNPQGHHTCQRFPSLPVVNAEDDGGRDDHKDEEEQNDEAGQVNVDLCAGENVVLKIIHFTKLKDKVL